MLAAVAMTPARAVVRKIDPLLQPARTVGKAATGLRLVAIASVGTRLIAAGAGGLVILSDDAGATWHQAAVPVSCDLTALHFRSTQLGWAVGHDGIILQTRDGGSHWTKALDGYGIAERIKTYYGAKGAFTGLGADFMEEVNRIAADGADKPLLDVRFVSDTEGFAIGAFNLALRTVDGGVNWQPVLERTGNPKSFHLYAMAQANGSVILAGEQGILRRWNPQAQAFVPVNSPYTGSFFGLLASDRALFAFGLQGRCFRTADGGETWKPLQSMGVAAVTAATALPDGRLVFVTQNGRVLLTVDDGDHWTDVSRARSTPCFGVAQAGPGAVALVGSSGVEILRLP